MSEMSDLSRVVSDLSNNVGKLSDSLADFKLESAKTLGDIHTELALLKAAPQSMKPGRAKLGIDETQWRPLIILVLTVILSAVGLGTYQTPPQATPPPPVVYAPHPTHT